MEQEFDEAENELNISEGNNNPSFINHTANESESESESHNSLQAVEEKLENETPETFDEVEHELSTKTADELFDTDISETNSSVSLLSTHVSEHNESEMTSFLEDKSDKEYDESTKIVSEKESSDKADEELKLEQEMLEDPDNSQNVDDDIIVAGNELSELMKEENENIFSEHSGDESDDTETISESSTEKNNNTSTELEDWKDKSESHDHIEELSEESVSSAQNVEDLSATSEFQEELKKAVEKAIQENPSAKNVVVIKYDKEDTHPSIQHVNVQDYKTEMYQRQEHVDNKTVEDILTQSMNGVISTTDAATDDLTDQLVQDITPAEANLVNDELNVDSTIHDTKVSADMIKEDVINNAIVEPYVNTDILDNKAFRDFEHVSLQHAIQKKESSEHHRPQTFKRQSKMAKTTGENPDRGEMINEQSNDKQEVYLTSHDQQREQARLFALHDAIKRATIDIPPGMPVNTYLSDVMGVSDVGEYKPSKNMLHYYGGISEFHQVFANKAKKQISFEDIDVLVGLISDVNGMFTTIYKLLPKQEEAEKEQEQTQDKSVLDHAYEVLKFYSQIRGFVNTVVFNRHLVIQDIVYLKDKVSNLHTSEEDMLYFYSLDVQHAKVKSRGSYYSKLDPKIDLFLKRVTDTSTDFQIDVKKILRAFFGFEKAVVFFDNDVRSLVSNINIQNPLEALKTVDRVVMILIRLIEIKIDIFRSLIELKDSFKNLIQYRTKIIDSLEGAEQIIHYHSLGTNSTRINSVRNILALFIMVMYFFAANDNTNDF